jgi:hypothetical protein
MLEMQYFILERSELIDMYFFEILLEIGIELDILEEELGGSRSG